MAVQRISIQQFLELAAVHPVVDVRSPSEFTHAHIPHAVSLPLFNDDERKIVGTTYKQQSREDAIKIGLDFFGPNMRNIVTAAEEILKNKKTKTILVHCWRGGMRSAAIAWLLDLYGFKVYTLQGGYKGFRNWVLAQFEKPYPFMVLGGYTGSGKTEILKAMQQKGALVIDLEGLAHHKGSAFGSLGMDKQPSPEMFENTLALLLHKLSKQLDSEQHDCIWVEGESQRIGAINIQHTLYKQIRNAPALFAKLPFEQRLLFITEGYGKFDKAVLIDAILRIKKRLGGLETKNAINHLLDDKVQDCFEILLKYYDRFYERSSFGEDRKVMVQEFDTVDAQKNAAAILQWQQNNKHELTR